MKYIILAVFGTLSVFGFSTMSYGTTSGWTSGGALSEKPSGPTSLKVTSVKIRPPAPKPANKQKPPLDSVNGSKPVSEVEGSSAGDRKPASVGPKKPLKLRNVKLVVEDCEDTTSEKLVPVDPVVLRQKPKSVPIVQGTRNSLVLPQPKDGSKLQNGDGSGTQEDSKPILIVSKVVEEEPPVLSPDPRGSFSPFYPPPPSALPSTLTQRETISVGSQGSELLPLPPVSNVGGSSDLDSNMPTVRIARASAVDPEINARFGGQSLPPLTRDGSQLVAQPSYYTDSESSALLHMATEPKDFEGPSSSVFGKMW